MSDTFKPLLTTTDWNEEWMKLQDAQHRSDDASMWDKRAKSFATKHGNHSPYVDRFIELAQIKSGETVLDMGCGSGALATPLAQAGHKVIACDFSSGMLNVMKEEQKALGVTGVTAVKMSWQDDWATCGVGNKSVDVALASRSIATHDLKEAMQKMTDVARRRVCITLPAGPSPKVNAEIMKAAGLEAYTGRDFIYAFNILVDMGILPEVEYIPSNRIDVFDSFDDALQLFSRLVEHAARGVAPDDTLKEVPDHLSSWLKSNLVQKGDHLELKEPFTTIWAFIAWNVA